MMDCRECQLLLPDLLSGSLPAARKKALAQHLEACPTCQLELAAERRLEEILSRPLKAPPADFTRRVLARTRQEKAPAPITPAGLIAALAGAASLTVLLWGLYQVAGEWLQEAWAFLSGELSRLAALDVPARSRSMLNSLFSGGDILPDLSQNLARLGDFPGTLFSEPMVPLDLIREMTLSGAGAVVILIILTWGVYAATARDY